jgi:hypothetical protein
VRINIALPSALEFSAGFVALQPSLWSNVIVTHDTKFTGDGETPPAQSGSTLDSLETCIETEGAGCALN